MNEEENKQPDPANALPGKSDSTDAVPDKPVPLDSGSDKPDEQKPDEQPASTEVDSGKPAPDDVRLDKPAPADAGSDKPDKQKLDEQPTQEEREVKPTPSDGNKSVTPSSSPVIPSKTSSKTSSAVEKSVVERSSAEGSVVEGSVNEKAEVTEGDDKPLAPPQPQYEKWPGEWYVLHTYSGYEDAVAESLKQRIDSLDMQDKIFGVLVPKENQIEIRGGKRRTVEKKIFPGYVLVNMNVTEDSWYVVRNTPSVTGFIGSGTIPVPVSRAEIQTILKRMAVEEPKYKIDLKSGDLVHINDGPFKSYNGTVSEVDEERGKIKVLVSIFGRETPVELDFLQVKKV